MFEDHCNVSTYVKPSLYMKILSINNFSIELLSKLLSDLSMDYDTKKFGSKGIRVAFLYERPFLNLHILKIRKV